MKILAIDSSAVSASVAMSDNEKVIAHAFLNNGLTHSQTLLPMVKEVLSQAQTDIHEVDLFAVSNGPGSFTGVRIGVAAVKGLAFEENKPCVGISTLEVIAANITESDCIVVSCMDARRSQVYTAAFESVSLKRLTPDEALSLEELAKRIATYNKKVYLSGDGAKIAHAFLKDKCDNVYLPPEENVFQNAEKMCALAFRKKQEAVLPAQLMPAYLRPSQAERELKKKRGEVS